MPSPSFKINIILTGYRRKKALKVLREVKLKGDVTPEEFIGFLEVLKQQSICQLIKGAGKI